MNKLLLFLHSLLLLSFSSYAADEIKGFKLASVMIEKEIDAQPLIQEINKLKVDEDYEVDADLCVVYGDSSAVGFEESFYQILENAGFTVQIYVYGSLGDHLIQIHDAKTSVYIGAISNIYECKSE